MPTLFAVMRAIDESPFFVVTVMIFPELFGDAADLPLTSDLLVDPCKRIRPGFRNDSSGWDIGTGRNVDGDRIVDGGRDVSSSGIWVIGLVVAAIEYLLGTS